MSEIKKFPVVFDSEAFFRLREGSRPLQAFKINKSTPAERAIVYEALRLQSDKFLKDPDGILRYPYIVPGGGYTQLWDWDSFFCGLARGEERPEFLKGCILNFLDHLRSDGRPPNLITTEEPHFGSIPLPLFAQWAAIASRLLNDVEWIKPWWERLLKQRQWFDESCLGRRGLYRLQVWPGHGLDNDPAIYGRRADTVAPVHVNCYHYREFKALAMLANRLGFQQDGIKFHARAQAMAKSINEFMWDPIDGLHYHLDLSDFEDIRGQEITWEVPYKMRSWACLYPLWAGICTPAQASRIVRDHVMNPQEFLSPYGIRSLAANECIYNNIPMGNPSNWQGPVWGISTFLTAYGLARCGFKQEALDIAGRLLNVYCSDFQLNGTIHESYNAETGAPVMKPGFVSWNLLAIRVLDDIEKGLDPTDLLNS